MHFCFSSMSYNLIKNFWCIASILNINMFHGSLSIIYQLEILEDVRFFKIPKVALGTVCWGKGDGDNYTHPLGWAEEINFGEA